MHPPQPMKQLRGTPLKRFLRDWRRAHPRMTTLTLLLQSVAYPVNVGSLFRIADAAGVSQVILSGITPLPSTHAVNKVSRDKQNDVPWSYVERAEDAIATLKSQGFSICGLEITDASTPYYDMEVPDKLCFVLGNEDHGLTRSVLSLCDTSVFVPMYGKGHSLNVHVSAAVVLFHVLHSQHENA